MVSVYLTQGKVAMELVLKRDTKVPDAVELIIVLRTEFRQKFKVIAHALDYAGYRTATRLRWTAMRVRAMFYLHCPEDRH